MAVLVERKPYVVVTDEESGWSLTGGRQYGDGASTKEMIHSNGATCTVSLVTERSEDAELTLRVTGMVYRNPEEDKEKYLFKEPGPGDFIQAPELYAVAALLTRAWYEASFVKASPLTIKLPSR